MEDFGDKYGRFRGKHGQFCGKLGRTWTILEANMDDFVAKMGGHGRFEVTLLG